MAHNVVVAAAAADVAATSAADVTAVVVCLSVHSSLDAAGVLSLCQIDASALEIRIICCCCCCDDLQLLLALACKALIA